MTNNYSLTLKNHSYPMASPSTHFAGNKNSQEEKLSSSDDRYWQAINIKSNLIQYSLLKKRKNINFQGGFITPLYNNSNDLHLSTRNNLLGNLSGFWKEKEAIYSNIILPLIRISKSNTSSHSSVPQGFCIFGPRGCGKTALAEGIKNICQERNIAQYEKINFSSNSEKDIELIEKKISEAEIRFQNSQNKKFTLFFVDEIDKKTGSKYDKVTMTLLKANKDKGVIIIGATDNIQSLDKRLFDMMQTRIPVNYLSNENATDFIQDFLESRSIPTTAKIDYEQINSTLKQKDFLYKPKDIVNRLLKAHNDICEYGNPLKTEDIIDTMINPAPEISITDREKLGIDLAIPKNYIQSEQYQFNETDYDLFKNENFDTAHSLEIFDERTKNDYKEIFYKTQNCSNNEEKENLLKHSINIKASKAGNTDSSLGINYLMLGDCLLSQNKLKDAENCYSHSYNILKNTNSHLLPFVCSNLGAACEKQGKYENAEICYNQALKLYNSNKQIYPLKVSETYLKIAKLCEKQGKIDNAKICYHQSLSSCFEDIAPVEKRKKALCEITSSLVCFYRKQNQYLTADKYAQLEKEFSEETRIGYKIMSQRNF